MKALLIINPISGDKKAKEKIETVRQLLKKSGFKLDVYVTKAPKDAMRVAKAATKKYHVVIAAGGDGTINEVANGLAYSKTKLGIVPLGTENVLAKELKMPSEPKKIAKIIAKGKTKVIDLGKAKNRYFVFVTGIGFDASTASKVKPFIKKLFGSKAYHLTGLKELFVYEPIEITVKTKNNSYKGYWVIISNTKLYGGSVKVTPKAKIDDGKLDVCILKYKHRLSPFKYFIAATAGKHLKLKGVNYFKAKEIYLKSEKPVLAHVDCELIGTTPLKVSVCPKALKVIVP